MYLRGAIRLLQVYPLITAVVFIIDIILDVLGVYITTTLEPVFGVSLLPLAIMYFMARRTGVQKWSRVLYVTLMVIPIIGTADKIFEFGFEATLFNRLMFAIIATGAISSFFTYLYFKYKMK